MIILLLFNESKIVINTMLIIQLFGAEKTEK